MPVPIRDNGQPGPTRRLLIFVHGFNSSPDTWEPMAKLLRADPQVDELFEVQHFGYQTGLWNVPVARRSSTIAEEGRHLADFLKRKAMRGPNEESFIDITLVGHSMGGLVIQSCLQWMLQQGRGRDVDHIRQVILFATPNFGSNVVTGIRRVFSSFFTNPQEEALRLFSAVSREIHEGIRDQVIFATERRDHQYPMPFYCFWGKADAVVPEISAKGHFPHGAPLPGDHFAVHSPGKNIDEGYEAFRDALFRPHGHQSIFEVEQFLFAVKVWPLAPGTQIEAKHGGKTRPVICDNAAHVIRRVTFSENNHCKDAYELKYGTRNGGWLDPKFSGADRTPADKRRHYDDNGCDVYFYADPVPGSTSTLDLTVYKGFDPGHRDFHMHLGRRTYFRRLSLELDLTEYLRAGWRVVPPRFYFHPDDPGDHLLCAGRELFAPEPTPLNGTPGIWRWELEYVKEGVVDFVFDVEPPMERGAAEPVIQLKAGEHAVFGYGSLLSIASMELTLGRIYSSPMALCTLDGWRRSWDVAMPNKNFVYDDGGEWVKPEKIFYLNIRELAGSQLNGSLFVVTDEELKKFDQREWIYDRVEVTEDVRGVRVQGGSAWAYRAKPEFVFPHPASPRQGAIRRTYLDILDTGHRDLGAEFTVAYDGSTDVYPAALVIADRRESDLK